MYHNNLYPSFNTPIYHNDLMYDDRFGGFVVPFLLGGLGGAAIVGLSRPRPVVVNPYTPQYNPYPYNYY